MNVCCIYSRNVQTGGPACASQNLTVSWRLVCRFRVTKSRQVDPGTMKSVKTSENPGLAGLGDSRHWWRATQTHSGAQRLHSGESGSAISC